MNAGARAGGKADRFLALDSLRGLLASTIVIFHVRAEGHLWDWGYIRNGFLAVTFFFILSGFVIGTSYGDRLAQGFPATRFLALRLGRIYPLHLFMIVLLIVWEGVRLTLNLPSVRHGPPFTGLFDPGLLPYNFALLQKFAGKLSWNDPSWSIGVEWWTYVVFALLAAFVAFRRGPLAVAGMLIVPGAAARLAGIDLPVGWAETVDCMLNFGLGLLVYHARNWPRLWGHFDRLSFAKATMLELLVAAVAIWMCMIFGGRLSPAIGPTFAIVIAVFSLERGWLSRLLVTAPMLMLGQLSYSIYMIHHFVLDRMLDLLWRFGPGLNLPVRATEGLMAVAGPKIACDLFSLVVLGLAIAASVYSYRYIEKPARSWSRRLINPNHSETVTPRDPPAAF